MYIIKVWLKRLITIASPQPGDRGFLGGVCMHYKAPNRLLVSHRLPAWIFFDRIYHEYLYLHISVTLNNRATGVMNTAMNVMLTNVSVYSA